MKILIIIILTLGVVLLPFKSKFDSVEKCKQILCAAFNVLSRKRVYYHLYLIQIILAIIAGFTIYKNDAMILGDSAYDSESTIDRFILNEGDLFYYGGLSTWIFVSVLGGLIMWSSYKNIEKKSSIILRYILQLTSVPLAFWITVIYLERHWLIGY